MYKPKKQLGQNFLIDNGVIKNIILKGEVRKEDIVLEIGPGQGSLTYALFSSAKKVIAVEKDDDLYKYLLKKFEKIKNVSFINDDILEYLQSPEFFSIFKNKKYKVFGNIPYYLTSHLIKELLSLENKPSEIVLMMQKEVAERMVAVKGEMNLLAISVQLLSSPEILFYVSKNSFWPKPKVDSAVIRISNLNPPIGGQISGIRSEKFFALVRAGFAAKRKTLANNLANGLGISKENIYDVFNKLKIDSNVRAQDLGIEDWVSVYKKIQKKKDEK